MKKRVFRKRPENHTTFTFHSYGSVHPFDPNRIIEDERIVNEANKFEAISMLNFYKEEVRMAKKPHVYILDNKGREVTV